VKVTLLEVKQALRDPRFRDSLPEELKPEVIKFLDNPGCGCNTKLYRKIMKDYRGHLLRYFPGAEIVDEAREVAKLAENNWKVINCHVSELEGELRKLAPGRKQVDVARYQDQVTVVVNEMDLIY
jgi:hypothetical protein